MVLNLVVTAPFEDSNATTINGDQNNNTAPISGAAYVFTRVGNSWTQQAYIKASNAGAQDFFGQSVSLSQDGSILAVGAHQEDGPANGSSNAGAVYVFSRSGSTWSEQAQLTASNPGAGDLFGDSVSLDDSGTTLAIGASGEDSNATAANGDQANDSAINAGAAYVFTRQTNLWTQSAYIKASNAGSFDIFGGPLSLSGDGNTLAVGARSETSNATGINGNQSNGTETDAGAVYVFERGGNQWSQQAYVKASNTDLGDLFGRSVSLNDDGSTMAVGAILESSNATGVDGDQADNNALASGAVYLY